MIIDCHMHYEPEMFPADRMLAAMEANGIDKTALIPAMVEPFTLHGKVIDLAGDFTRVSLLHANPIGQLAYQSTLSQKGNFTPLGKKYRIYDEIDNSAVAKVIDEHPDKFLGWIFVNPAVDSDPVSTIEKWSSNPAMIGVKSHPFWHRYAIEKLDSTADWCAGHSYPLLIHLGCKDSGDYERLPEKYPGLKIVYAHAGVPYYRKLWAYIKDKKNLFVDLSSPLYLNRKLIEMAVDYLGPDKCLYGNDGPYGPQAMDEDFNYSLVKGWIESLPLSDKALEKIFHENFEAIRKS
jgi:predicted TIM-barrel fold metal-dependent hydrolase